MQNATIQDWLTDPKTGDTHLFTMSSDGKATRLYRDGVLVAGPRSVDSFISAPRVYPRALTKEEVQAEYEAHAND